MSDKRYWIGLSMIKGLGPIRISKLLKYYGDPYSIWKASVKELSSIDGIGRLARKIVDQRKKINLSKILSILDKNNINVITLEDNKYPKLLKNIYDPPPVIYYKGKFNLDFPTVSIIGSRRSTVYGRKIAEKLAYELSKRGIMIVSGMARGIDTHGHIGALKAKGVTVAVLGSGLDIIYPPENRELFHEISKKGVVLSEFPPGTEPLPQNFPRRNRIISGLSQGVVVVEASNKSGSLITADLALEQGRDLFAVPGNIDRPQSKGTNNLIKKGAKIVTKVDDILEELYLYKDADQNQEKFIYPELTKKEEKIINLLQMEGELHINKIIEETGYRVEEVNTLLLKLELKGLVSRGAGKKYAFLGLQNLLKPI